MTHHSLPSYFMFFNDALVLTLYILGVPAIELVLEIRKSYFWRNVLIHQIC